MVVVVAHEPSARFLGPGLALVDRDDALEFVDAATAETFLARHASEPCFVTEAVEQPAA